MRKYNFEYYNRNFALKLGGLCVLLFITLLFVMRSMRGMVQPALGIIIVLGIPALIFYLNRKKAKAYGNATIYDHYVEFELNNKNTIVNFNDIKSYLLQQYQGTLLNIRMKNGSTLNIRTNSNFNQLNDFDVFCNELEPILLQYSNQGLIIRRKTFFEKAWIFPFLLVATGLVLFFVSKAIYDDRKLPFSSLLITFGALVSLWGGYYSAKIKKLK